MLELILIPLKCLKLGYIASKMKLTNEQLNKFQGLYEQRFGETLEESSAMEMGLQLMELVRHTFKPVIANGPKYENEYAEKPKTKNS